MDHKGVVLHLKEKVFESIVHSLLSTKDSSDCDPIMPKTLAGDAMTSWDQPTTGKQTRRGREKKDLVHPDADSTLHSVEKASTGRKKMARKKCQSPSSSPVRTTSSSSIKNKMEKENKSRTRKTKVQKMLIYDWDLTDSTDLTAELSSSSSHSERRVRTSKGLAKKKERSSSKKRERESKPADSDGATSHREETTATKNPTKEKRQEHRRNTGTNGDKSVKETKNHSRKSSRKRRTSNADSECGKSFCENHQTERNGVQDKVFPTVATTEAIRASGETATAPQKSEEPKKKKKTKSNDQTGTKDSLPEKRKTKKRRKPSSEMKVKSKDPGGSHDASRTIELEPMTLKPGTVNGEGEKTIKKTLRKDTCSEAKLKDLQPGSGKPTACLEGECKKRKKDDKGDLQSPKKTNKKRTSSRRRVKPPDYEGPSVSEQDLPAPRSTRRSNEQECTSRGTKEARRSSTKNRTSARRSNEQECTSSETKEARRSSKKNRTSARRSNEQECTSCETKEARRTSKKNRTSARRSNEQECTSSETKAAKMSSKKKRTSSNPRSSSLHVKTSRITLTDDQREPNSSKTMAYDQEISYLSKIVTPVVDPEIRSDGAELTTARSNVEDASQRSSRRFLGNNPTNPKRRGDPRLPTSLPETSRERAVVASSKASSGESTNEHSRRRSSLFSVNNLWSGDRSGNASVRMKLVPSSLRYLAPGPLSVRSKSFLERQQFDDDLDLPLEEPVKADSIRSCRSSSHRSNRHHWYVTGSSDRGDDVSGAQSKGEGNKDMLAEASQSMEMVFFDSF